MEDPLAWRLTWNHYPVKLTGAPKLLPYYLDYPARSFAEEKKRELLQRFTDVVVTITPIYLSRAARSKRNRKAQISVAHDWPPQARTVEPR